MPVIACSTLPCIAMCAVICSAEGWKDSEEYGHVQADRFEALSDFPHGMPSHETCRGCCRASTLMH